MRAYIATWREVDAGDDRLSDGYGVREKGNLPPFILILKILVVILLLIPLSSKAGYAEKDGGVRHEIVGSAIIPILIAHKICFDERDCHRRNVVQASARSGVEIFIYGISDRKLINELLAAITQASNQYPPELQLSVDVYAHPFSERSIWKRSIASLFIKGRK